MSRLITLTCAAVATAALFTGSPAAGEPASFPNRTVHYSDLNMSTDAGARQLIKRIVSAARNVCTDISHGHHDLETELRYRACRAQAADRAVMAVGSERVARLYRAKSQPPILTARR